MKAETLIQLTRQDYKNMIAQHELYVKTNGAAGMHVFNPESLYKKLDRTEEEIIRLAQERGVYIVDADEYLEQLKKEKTL